MTAETPFEHAKIVFLDDNPNRVERALQALVRGGVHVDAQRCCDAESLRLALVTFDPDLVISDIELANLSMGSAIEMVRAHHAQLPVLMLSDQAAPRHVVQAMQAGARGYVLATEPDELIAEVERLLADTPTAPPAAPSSEHAGPRDTPPLRRLAEAAGLGLRITDRASQTLFYLSPACADLWGLSPNALVTDPTAWQGAIHPEDRAEVLQALARHGRQSSYDQTFRVVHPDGEPRWLRDRAVDLPAEAGRAPACAWLTEDVTRIRALEGKLLKAQKMDTIGRLSGGIAHAFNNLLQTVFGFVELTETSLEPGHEAQPYMVEIRDAAQRAESLTRQLLLFSHNRKARPRLTHLGDVLVSMDSILRRELGHDIDVEVDLEDGVRPILADTGQLEQVVLNLAANARQAMPYGGVFGIATRQVHIEGDLRTRAGEPVATGLYTELVVSDDGKGMDPDTLKRAFEPFFSTRSATGSAGVGLATVEEIVRQNGGHVWMRSQPNEGTTVRLLFPSQQPRPDERPAKRPARRALAQRVVLLVEHELTILDQVALLLTREGCPVLRASAGAEALRPAATHPGTLDLLLTDVAMPGLHGSQIHQRLRQTNPALPAVFMSGYSSDLAAQEWGVDPSSTFLQKPFQPDQLLEAVRGALAKTP